MTFCGVAYGGLFVVDDDDSLGCIIIGCDRPVLLVPLLGFEEFDPGSRGDGLDWRDDGICDLQKVLRKKHKLRTKKAMHRHKK